MTSTDHAIKLAQPSWAVTAATRAENIYFRVLSVVFFAMSILIWMKVIGFWPGAENRFDTMSVPWKVYASVLLVLAPVVSVGLWTTLFWGRVVWFIVIGFQSVAIFQYPVEFGGHKSIVFLHP
ncbi:MAG: DUF6163 family protein [Pseudomonadota bacterium]